MFVLDTTTVTHGIQLAVAPVFLLTAVAGMIGAIAGRLARIIDRARVVEEKGMATDDPVYLERARAELAQLRRRGRLANVGIALLTLCAVLIGTTIIVLFVGETTEFESGKLAVIGFLCGVVSFLLALVCFLVETVIATRILNFYLPEKPQATPTESL